MSKTRYPNPSSSITIPAQVGIHPTTVDPYVRDPSSPEICQDRRPETPPSGCIRVPYLKIPERERKYDSSEPDLCWVYPKSTRVTIDTYVGKHFVSNSQDLQLD